MIIQWKQKNGVYHTASMKNTQLHPTTPERIDAENHYFRTNLLHKSRNFGETILENRDTIAEKLA